MIPADLPDGAPVPRPKNNKYDYIDAVRGWAILLVITCHVGGRFAELPYPVKKLTNFGWHGVQMFFLASAVTLMMSWARKKEAGWTAAWHFFIRRFLRIAPMYYTGALIYFIAEPPDNGFDLAQMLRSFLFINAWHPDWIPTTPGWMVVPGGWSIGVEFTFYALFPVLATLLVTLPRAVLFFFGALVLSVYANQYGLISFDHYSKVAVDNFLYFWFPNQVPIFALGIILYHLLTKTSLTVKRTSTAYTIIAAVFVACAVAAERPTSSNLFNSLIFMPTVFFAALSFMVFIIVVAKGPETLFTHPWIRRLGVLSFSSYVLHFYFVYAVPVWSGGLIDPNAKGFAAIGTFVALWVLTVIGTAAAATVAHRFIEQPGMNLARWLTSSRKAQRAASTPLRPPTGLMQEAPLTPRPEDHP